MKKTARRKTLVIGSILSAILLSGTAWAQTTAFSASYTCGRTSESIEGEEPVAAGAYPVFLYMIGTAENFNANAAADAAVRGMAERGYVAASIDYNNSSFGNCSQISAKAQCIFNPSSASSAVSVLCGRAKADCSKGIVVGGFSQGAVIATLAKNFDSRVQAAWGLGDGVKYSSFNLTSCMANGNRTLHSDRLRAVNGNRDQFTGNSESAQQTNMQSLTGFTCASGATTCLQSNGSGWVIVQGNQTADGTADHCYMRASGGCTGRQTSLDQGWANGAAPWELDANLDWLKGFTAH